MSCPDPFPPTGRALGPTSCELRQPTSWLNLPAEGFGMWRVTYSRPCICLRTQAHGQPPDHSTPGTHTHAHARVHMAQACSRALGAHWYPGVAERAHTHTHMQTASSFYSRSPVIIHKQNSHSPSRPHVPRRQPGGTRAPLTFPPLNPARSRGQLPARAGEGRRGDPCPGPPLCSRSR